jgi:hypothetical protein
VSDEDNRTKEATDLYSWVGITITQWQRVEDEHYLLFLKMLGAPNPQIASIIYFSPPTFESRRVMVDRVAQVFLSDAEKKKEWKKLNDRLSGAASNRGQVAHYGLDYEIVSTGESPSDLRLGAPRLRPSKHNKIAEMKGQSHKVLTSQKLRGYVLEFFRLEQDVNRFCNSLDLPPPRQGLDFLSALLPPPGWTPKLPPRHLRTIPPADEPFGEPPNDPPTDA